MKKISANGIRDVCDVTTMMAYEGKGIDDEHALMGSKKAFVHRIDMRDFGMAVASKYLACYFILGLCCALLSPTTTLDLFHTQSSLSSSPYSPLSISKSQNRLL